MKKNDIKIITLAENILQSKVGIIEGCKTMFSLLSQEEIESEKDLLIFTVVASEADGLPIGQIRKLWNKDKLKAKDREIHNFEKYYKDSVFTACKKLILNLNDHNS